MGSNPTHVVVSVTYGLNAFMTFKKKVNHSSRIQDIEASLHIAVRKIPQFEIEGEGHIILNEKLNETVRDLNIQIYSDAVVNVPASYQESAKVLKELQEKARYTTRVTSFKVVPLETYCGGTEVILTRLKAHRRICRK